MFPNLNSLFVSPPVPEYFIRSSQLHHGEGGEHPPLQPVAPAHAHLDGFWMEPSDTDTVELMATSAVWDWTDTPLCQYTGQETKPLLEREKGFKMK